MKKKAKRGASGSERQKRNPQDLTLRNIRALKKRAEKLEHEMSEMPRAIKEHLRLQYVMIKGLAKEVEKLKKEEGK